MQHEREAPNLDEVLRFAERLPPEQAEKFLRSVRPAQRAPEPEDEHAQRPPLTYLSFARYLEQVSPVERLRRCRSKAKTANRARLMSGRPDTMITAEDVWAVIEAAQGRCEYCGCLALEPRPSGPNGQPLPWAPIGRRIGSLSHRIARFNGGANTMENLGWSCLWCNTWPIERKPGATDHGGYQPQPQPQAED